MRNRLPPPPAGVTQRLFPSGANNSVLVTISSDRDGLPPLLKSIPLRAGWFRMYSGVSPLAAVQRWSPVLRSMAVIRPHGGLTSGKPCGPLLVGCGARPPPSPSSIATNPRPPPAGGPPRPPRPARPPPPPPPPT